MTMEMIRATQVEAFEGYVIRVSFSDGAVKDIDMSGELAEAKGVFQALRDPKVFCQVRVNELNGAVEWPGEIDLDPEVLYGLFEPASGGPMTRRTIREPLHAVG
jgi:hypothetical protein